METMIALDLPYISHMTKPCAVAGCSGIVHARGWCVQHYTRFRFDGDPGPVHRCLACGKQPRGRGKHAYCSKECSKAGRRIYVRTWREQNKDRQNTLARSRRSKNIEASRAYQNAWRKRNAARLAPLLRERQSRKHFEHCLEMFGLTEQQYRDLATLGCALCGKQDTRRDHRTGKMVRLSFDHSHATGAFRGLLCGTCNTRLGWYEQRREQVNHYLSNGAWNNS